MTRLQTSVPQSLRIIRAKDAVELYQLGCEYAQGFAFGEPMSAEQARTMITSERLETAR